ncbi:hypothetical protein IMCC3135_19575 [Granulosicoccus antarcticus IMCC3135]|uniref:Uncharacterized protein n=1 Tax=Granulosicoccus antarcticus IMCC3135 TaxID=1192854 RepID=A0A2Z2P2Q6_9GAMM|nr:hypothetical protein IMCC3135_19575 [Granulosicoccus antarcticus IMCC3135]
MHTGENALMPNVKAASLRVANMLLRHFNNDVLECPSQNTNKAVACVQLQENCYEQQLQKSFNHITTNKIT